MNITPDDVKKFADQWFHCVRSGGTGDEQAKFHIHRDARIFIGNGNSFSLDEHCELHKQWTDEKHLMGFVELTKINDQPERVRAEVTVYWEARYRKKTSGNSLIQAVAGESWLLENTPTGLKFILYVSKTYTLLPNSGTTDF
jgi:hypothetical protein